MYNLNSIQNALKNPKLIARELNRLYYTRLYTNGYSDGCYIVDEDWDNLIILDGCRYDLYVQNNILEGDLESKQSIASETQGFLSGNFSGKSLEDTVYVTANPMFERNKEDLDVDFHSVHNVWVDEGWDEELGTLKPETMTENSIRINKKYPEKRMIFHYMQPHYPFISSKTTFDKVGALDEPSNPVPWKEIMKNNVVVDEENVWKAYEENLINALHNLKKLLPALVGKTVVTSDHGNMIGDRSFPIPIKEFGHPHKIFTPELVTVPWHVLPFNSRKGVTKGTPEVNDNDVDEEEVKNKLRDLGYV